MVAAAGGLTELKLRIYCHGSGLGDWGGVGRGWMKFEIRLSLASAGVSSKSDTDLKQEDWVKNEDKLKYRKTDNHKKSRQHQK